uniref:Uncharacterized protein n=1 Tax=Clastoptera arizonana TaxID=38151 RepID=A0A1B6CII8_9HEMI
MTCYFLKQKIQYKMVGFVGVHAGAGRHSERLRHKYEILCQKACKEGIKIIKTGGSHVDAAVIAAQILEDSALTNAGFGSNLTFNGDVECDASIMDGQNCTFGACGAVAGVKNPIALARSICDAQRMPLTLGRVPPW